MMKALSRKLAGLEKEIEANKRLVDEYNAKIAESEKLAKSEWPEAERLAAEKKELAELEKVAADGITDAELDLAKGNISGGLALKFESTQARMSRLTGAELTDGEFIDLDESLSRYDAVTLADVQVVAKLMSESKKSFIAVGDVKDDLFDEFV
jgi:predicted Zn-dependent peptidase